MFHPDIYLVTPTPCTNHYTQDIGTRLALTIIACPFNVVMMACYDTPINRKPPHVDVSTSSYTQVHKFSLWPHTEQLQHM